MRDPELRAHAARRGRRPPTRRCCSSSIPSAAFPLGDPPDYEPDAADERRRASPRRRAATPLEVFYDAPAGGRRPRARDAAAAQLHRLQPRRRARDAAAPDERVGPRRRRRALRHDLRREHAHVHAHALGARPRRTTGCRSSGSCSKMTRETAALYGLGDRGALAPGHARRRATSSTSTGCTLARAARWCTTCPATRRRFVQGADGYVATVKRGEVDPARRRTTRAPARPARPRRARGARPRLRAERPVHAVLGRVANRPRRRARRVRHRRRGARELAAAAEAAGFGACYVTDHPFPDDRWLATGGHHALDPMVVLAVAGAATTTLRLQTHVFVRRVPQPVPCGEVGAEPRRPVGRAGDPRRRGRIPAAGVRRAGRRLRRTQRAHRRGDRRDGRGVDDRRCRARRSPLPPRGNTMLPRPIAQPHPPIWVGGNSKLAIRRAVERGQGWLPFPNPQAASSALSAGDRRAPAAPRRIRSSCAGTSTTGSW